MTIFLNNYQAPSGELPAGIHLDTPVNEYDFNWTFEVKTLQSDRVELRPMVPSLHAQLLYDGLTKYPEILEWLSLPVPQSLNEVCQHIERAYRAPPDALCYAIFTDKPGSTTPSPPEDWEFAGQILLFDASRKHLSLEPGYILILPPFQRTHVLTHAAGLLLHRTLDLPFEGGLGLRRCQWGATTLNTKSRAAAQRLGFTFEGVLRAGWVLPPGKKGARPARKGDPYEDRMQRDNWYASVISDDWENGAREHIDKLMARR